MRRTIRIEERRNQSRVQSRGWKDMAEYLSPGVYVEEFESGAKPMEGVSTSTAGFIGLAERGPAEGVPQLVTNPADFKRIYGGYLSENEFGEYRFLAYAVDQFFLNGGSRCFVSRVAPKNAACSEGFVPTKEAPVLKLSAKNPGVWGDDIRLVAGPANKAKTQILEILETEAGKRYVVKNGAGFNPGDVIAYTDQTKTVYNKVVKSQDNILTLEEDFDDTVVDKGLLPTKVIITCEFSLEISYNDIVEVYDNLSFNIQAPSFVEKKMAKSDLVNVQYVGTQDGMVPPFIQLAGEGKAVASISLSGGSNGSVSAITAADFIGEDYGAGKRTGIQSFLDNDMVSRWLCQALQTPTYS